MCQCHRRDALWRGRCRRTGLIPLLLPLLATGCPGRHPGRMADEGAVPAVVEVRDIRVLIAAGVEPMRFRVSGDYTVRDPASRVVERAAGRQWCQVTGTGSLTVGRRTFTGNRAEVVPAAAGTFEFSHCKNGKWSPAGRYGGRLTFMLRRDGSLAAINSVDVDTYVAGVLTRELYPDFHGEAYRAQAIAARTYALYEMSQKANNDYDVTATEASQVFGGLATGRCAGRAVEAVQYTRGIICTWTSPQGERIFCTYYSSACGGQSQDVADCKPTPRIPPLAGGVKCNYCRIAKGNVYRWGPVQIGKPELYERLTASRPEWSDLGGLGGVQVVSRTRFGRLGTIRLVGSSGTTHEMRAEDFRLAVGSRVMRSTDCRLSDDGEHLTLSDGRGFGHGIGLCQWGAQGQALAGRNAAQIVKFYYPGAHLTRAY